MGKRPGPDGARRKRGVNGKRLQLAYGQAVSSPLAQG